MYKLSPENQMKIFRNSLSVIAIFSCIGILYLAVFIQDQLHTSDLLPNEAIETLNLYVYHDYSGQIKIVDEELVNRTSATETWCVITEPVNGDTHWRLVRIGEFRWDVYPSSRAEFEELSCISGS